MSVGPVLVPLLALLTGSVAAACGPRTDGIGPGVLLIAVDGLRADHLGVYGYDRDTSPNLTALAAEGVRFEEVFASAPQLIPAHVALLTGCEPLLARRLLLPELEGLDERRWFVPERGVHLAVEFLSAGYATAAFVDHEHLGEAQGFEQGFQTYQVLDAAGRQAWEGAQSTRIVDHFLQWLRALPAGRPWFAVVHLNALERCWSDPAAYSQGTFQPRPELARIPPVASTDSVFFAVPRSRWRGGPRTLGQYEAVYDDAIHALDQELARLFASLRRLDRYEATSLHVLGSYGMQMGEAGLYLSAGRYSQADLGVPWIFRPRGAPPEVRGRALPGLVSTLDFAPTVLALEGLQVPAAMSGRSQAAVARDPRAPVAERRMVFASCGLASGFAAIGEHYVLEHLVPEGTSDAQLRRSWFGLRTEFGRHLGLSFYARARLLHPPLEAEAPAAARSEASAFKDEAFRWRNDNNDARRFLQAPPGRSELDPTTLERLRARGYAEAGP